MGDVGLKVALEVGEVRSLPAAEELVLEVAEDLLGRRVVQAAALLAGHTWKDTAMFMTPQACLEAGAEYPRLELFVDFDVGKHSLAFCSFGYTVPTMAYNYNVLHIANIRMDDMGYADMIRNNANSTDIREYLVSGDQTAITIRIPDTLRDAAKEAAALKGTSLSAYVRECLIKELTNGR